MDIKEGGQKWLMDGPSDQKTEAAAPERRITTHRPSFLDFPTSLQC